VQAELRRLGAIWRGPDAARALREAAGYIPNRAAIAKLPEPMRSWARDHPDIAFLAGADPALLRRRYQRFLTKPEYADLNTSPEAFVGYLRKHEANILRPAIAEAGAASDLAARFDAFVLRGGPAGDRFGKGTHNPNDPGLDLVLVGRTPSNREEGTRVPVILGDDKSVRDPTGGTKSVSSVPALVEHLVRDLTIEAAMQRRALDAQERQGLPIARDHREGVEQMERAAKDLRDLELLWSGDPDRFSNPDYIRRVSEIMVREQLLLVVTSQRGDAASLSDVLVQYGFILVR